MLTAHDIRSRFLDFFEKRQHLIIPSASLVPENDPSVLFTTAGMQPLVPYLMGEPYPGGARRLANAQKCLRTGDIEEVGDRTHLTFFEMLGNWSLGDYFKREAITWSYEFLTSRDEGLGLDPRRLYVTVFGGDMGIPRDDESFAIWRDIFTQAGLNPERRIFYLDAQSNWWSPGDNGPCGPDTEMFYDVTGEYTEGLTKEAFLRADDRQEVVEIWNDVFMEYEKRDGRVVGKLKRHNVDTGTGLERITAVVQGKDNVFETDIFAPLFALLDKMRARPLIRERRIVADHMRAAAFAIADGVSPSNTDRGYVVRRLIRRAVRVADILNVPEDSLARFVDAVADTYREVYPDLAARRGEIASAISEEERKFRVTLTRGMRVFEKIATRGKVTGDDAFRLFATYGFPIELIRELAAERNMPIDNLGFERLLTQHRELSRTASSGKFKGGLADTGERTTALHTCTHLLLAGLRKYLGDDVHQAGSNITPERTRFDFTYPKKVDREILNKVEAYVNEAIQKGCRVEVVQMEKEEARAAGVEGSFWEKYPDMVNVYRVVANDGTVYSEELCGGPHVAHTSEIHGVFRIKKEESSSAGVRRIKAVLENDDVR